LTEYTEYRRFSPPVEGFCIGMSELANALAPGRRSILPPTPGDERAGAPMHGSGGM
jgi:hypothetical protein